jgi:hypothetical protein
MSDATNKSYQTGDFVIRFNNDGIGADAFEVRQHSSTTPVTLLKIDDFTHMWTLTGDLIALDFFAINFTGVAGPILFRDAGGNDNIQIHPSGTAQFNGGAVIPTVTPPGPNGYVSGNVGDMLLLVQALPYVPPAVPTYAYYLCICDGSTTWTHLLLS